MDGYSGGYGYLGSGFTTSGDGQQENNTVDQDQVSLPYTQQLNLPVEQDLLQSYPHLRQTVGHEFQSPLSPLTTQHSGITRFPLPFPQMSSFPSFQNAELLQQFLDLQQISPGGRQQSSGIGNYGSVMNNYLQSSLPYMTPSVSNSLGNVQLTHAPKSPIDLHCSPSVSPTRTSPDLFGYSQPVSSVITSVIETHTDSADQNQDSLPLSSINASASNAYPLQIPYPFKVKQETSQIYDSQAAFNVSQSIHHEQNINTKIPAINLETEEQFKDTVEQNLSNIEKVIPDSILKPDQNENVIDSDPETKNKATCIGIEADLQNRNDDRKVGYESRDTKIEIVQGNVKSSIPVFENSSNYKEEKQSVSVRFICLGNLSRSSRALGKGPQEILSEPVDCEERMFTDIILNLPVTKNDLEPVQKSGVIDERGIRSEDSKAELHTPKPQEDIPKEDIDTDNEMEDDNEMHSSTSKQELDEYEADESHLENSMSFDGLGIQDNWYSAAMKKYAELNGEVSPDVMTAKKGGRSDPDNPFAITSPSFSESAARALVVTTNSSNATLVMVSIMSIGSRQKLIPKLVSSDAAEGGIVSIVNPIETADSESKASEIESSLKTETTSIMSKLNREKKEKEEEDDNSIDRLDISIKIDDDQFISHGEQKRWQCKLCPKSYTTKHNLVAHILDHCCIKPHLCLVCGKYFKQLSHLNTHMLTHDNVKPHVCNICHKGFTQISHLKRHQAVHYDSKPYICDICNRGFAYPSELRIHKDKHIPGKDKCVDCGAEFPSQKELREHMDTHEHRNDLSCQHCDRVFRFPSQLRDHMMSHAGSRPFICTECGMDFMKEHHLKAHQFTHTGLRPYACPHCARSFNQKANMVRHMLIHNAQRAFKCEMCGKTFTQPQTLKAHMVVHADKKPYSCKFCGKQFGRLHNLQGHLHIHNNTKPYVCSICGSSFTLKGNLNRHKKVKHGLSESMESMEEDAVNFLGNLSDRFRDADSSYDDLETSRDDSMVSDSKSPKKGRKSIPRKRINRQSEGDSATMFENGDEVENLSDEELDSERMNELTYSEEERENEERMKLDEERSKYFDSVKHDNKSRRKRKQDMSFRVEDIEDFDSKEIVGEETDEGIDAEKDDETEYETEAYDISESEKNGEKEGVIPEKRSTRKRKVKCLAEGFVGDNFGDDEMESWSPQPTKVRKKKGAKLDSLIASKFKSM